MDEETTQEISQLKRELREAKQELARARTPGQEHEARQEVKQARRDLRDVAHELRDEGNLSEAKRLEEYLEEQEYSRHKARADRYFKERGIEFVDDDEAPGDEDEAEEEEELPRGRSKRNGKTDRKTTAEKPPPGQHFVDRPLFSRKER